MVLNPINGVIVLARHSSAFIQAAVSFSWSLCTIYNFFMITINCFCCNQTKWLVAFIAGFLKYDKQAQGWKRVQEFDKEQILSVPQGYYVELNFTMHSRFPLPCLWGSNLEIRDGNNQSANFLGEFCGDYGTGVVRSSGRYMWLKLMRKELYDFAAFYTDRSNDETGMDKYTPNLKIYINYIYLSLFWKYSFSKTLQICKYISKTKAKFFVCLTM